MSDTFDDPAVLAAMAELVDASRRRAQALAADDTAALLAAAQAATLARLALTARLSGLGWRPPVTPAELR